MAEQRSGRRRYRMAARADAAAERRERILAAAWRRFADDIYERVRLRDIAADASVSVQTVVSAFGTKDQLFVAAWIWAIGPEGARRDRAPVGDVREAVRLLYDSYEHQGDASLRLLLEEDRIPAIRAMTNAGRAWHRSWVERTFAPLLIGSRGAARERRARGGGGARGRRRVRGGGGPRDILVWKLLRREMGLDRAAAERVVI